MHELCSWHPCNGRSWPSVPLLGKLVTMPSCATTSGSTLWRWPMYLAHFAASTRSPHKIWRCRSGALPWYAASIRFARNASARATAALSGWASVIRVASSTSWFQHPPWSSMHVGSCALDRYLAGTGEGSLGKRQQPVGKNLCHVEFGVHNPFEE